MKKFTCSTQVHIKYKIFNYYFKLLNKKRRLLFLIAFLYFSENDLTSSSYRFLRIQVPYSSYSKLCKDLATINLVDRVLKLWLFIEWFSFFVEFLNHSLCFSVLRIIDICCCFISIILCFHQIYQTYIRVCFCIFRISSNSFL